MKKFNKLVCVGVLGLVGLFSGVVSAADSNISIREYTVDGLNTQCMDVLFYNAYTENTTGEVFSGSTTVSGGSGTFSNGAVNVAGWTGNKDFGFYFAPTTAGSVTVNIYGVFGSTTVGAGTSNAALLMNPYIFAGTAATSTTFTITQDPTFIAVGINVTSGTVATTGGMHLVKAK